ncbi:MAG: methylmalonyl-CoA decarboxylase [Desulfuromonadaceae bacterium]|nr:methylmalonyl-CoA decarboxylase [Desulfuromonadaceae bacterium]
MTMVLTHLCDDIGTIIMNNPERLNVLSSKMVDDMLQALDQLEKGRARVIVIRAYEGAKVWSSGHDINELPVSGRDPLPYDDPLETILRSIQASPLPVIAMIEGGVWGGACDLALSCDILIGSPGGSLTMTPAKISVPYNASGILHFIGIMGINIAKEMFFSAEPLSAERAEKLGILNHLVPVDELEHFTYELAGKIAKNSPLSIKVIKEQICLLAGAHPLSPHTFERVQGLRRLVYDSSDYAEGINAFLAKRAPLFLGE